MSRPFQGQVLGGKLFSPALATAQPFGVIDRLTLQDNCRFLAWDDQPIAWLSVTPSTWLAEAG